MMTMGPTRAYRARKPRISGLQWPKPLYFRLIVLGARGHKSRSVACLLLPRCLLHRCTGFRVTWGQENGPRDPEWSHSEWQTNPHRHPYVCGCTSGSSKAQTQEHRPAQVTIQCKVVAATPVANPNPSCPCSARRATDWHSPRANGTTKGVWPQAKSQTCSKD